jgi:preprotein translocase subunit SecA
MDAISSMMQKTGLEDDMPIQASMVSKSIESAQRQVESMHFAARKNVLEYDDVMNLQRKAIYDERNAILDGKNIEETVPEIIHDSVMAEAQVMLPADSASDDWDIHALEIWASGMSGREDFKIENIDHDDDAEVVETALNDFLMSIFNEKEQVLGKEVMNNLASQVMLRIMDTKWMAHLSEMDYLKTGIGLRAIGQRDPLVEYKNEAYTAFENMTASMYDDFIRTLLRLEIAIQIEEPAPVASQQELKYTTPEDALTDHTSAPAMQAANSQGSSPAPVTETEHHPYEKDKSDPFANVGRNDPCPCGSGKKYKKCHGANL